MWHPNTPSHRCVILYFNANSTQTYTPWCYRMVVTATAAVIMFAGQLDNDFDEMHKASKLNINITIMRYLYWLLCLFLFFCLIAIFSRFWGVNGSGIAKWNIGSNVIDRIETAKKKVKRKISLLSSVSIIQFLFFFLTLAIGRMFVCKAYRFLTVKGT